MKFFSQIRKFGDFFGELGKATSWYDGGGVFCMGNACFGKHGCLILYVYVFGGHIGVIWLEFACLGDMRRGLP